MKKLGKILNAKWITVWLVVAIVVLCGGVVLARYGTTRNVVKRVIANSGETGNRFTSNYLLTTSSASQIRNVSESYAGTVEFSEINIYNYTVTRPAQWYTSDLDFSLTPVITSIDGATDLTKAAFDELIGQDSIYLYRVNGNTETLLATINSSTFDSVNGEPISQTIVKSPTSGTYNTYKLVMPNSAVDEFAVRLTATPASKHRDLSDSTLYCRFGARSQAIELTLGWEGAFTDDVSVTLPYYDGFNFSLTGSGESEGTLSWRSDLLEPNYNKMSELFNISKTTIQGLTPDANNMVSVTIQLDSEESSGRYDIPFYIVDPAARSAINAMTWTDFENTVVFTETSNP